MVDNNHTEKETDKESPRNEIFRLLDEFRDLLDNYRELHAKELDLQKKIRDLVSRTFPEPHTPAEHATANESAASRKERAPSRELAEFRTGARRMLKVLARHHPLQLTRAQLATLSSLKATGGAYAGYLSQLRNHGLISVHNNTVTLTEQGRRETGVTTTAPMTAEERREAWLSVLRGGARKMLTALLENRDRGLLRHELAAEAGLEPTGGAFSTYLSQLRRNGLAEIVDGRIYATAIFDSK